MGSGGLLGPSWTLPDTFLTNKMFENIFDQKLLLTTSNDPPDTSQMIPNNFKTCQTNVKNLVKILGPSRVLDHSATEGDWIAPTPGASPAACPPGVFFRQKRRLKIK